MLLFRRKHCKTVSRTNICHVNGNNKKKCHIRKPKLVERKKINLFFCICFILSKLTGFCYLHFEVLFQPNSFKKGRLYIQPVFYFGLIRSTSPNICATSEKVFLPLSLHLFAFSHNNYLPFSRTRKKKRSIRTNKCDLINASRHKEHVLINTICDMVQWENANLFLFADTKQGAKRKKNVELERIFCRVFVCLCHRFYNPRVLKWENKKMSVVCIPDFGMESERMCNLSCG